MSVFIVANSAGPVLNSGAKLTVVSRARHFKLYCIAKAIPLYLLGAHFPPGSLAQANV